VPSDRFRRLCGTSYHVAKRHAKLARAWRRQAAFLSHPPVLRPPARAAISLCGFTVWHRPREDSKLECDRIACSREGRTVWGWRPTRRSVRSGSKDRGRRTAKRRSPSSGTPFASRSRVMQPTSLACSSCNRPNNSTATPGRGLDMRAAGTRSACRGRVDNHP